MQDVRETTMTESSTLANKLKAIGRIPKSVKSLIKFTLLAIVLFVVFKQIGRNWHEIIHYDWSINVWLLMLSIMAQALTFLMFSNVWCMIISGFGYDVSLKHGFKLAYISNLGRYLPGKFWTIFGMAYLARRLDIKEEESVASWVIAIIFSLPTAFLISFITVIIYPEILSDKISAEIGITAYVFFGITLIGSFLLIFLPSRTLALLNFFLKLIKRPAVNFRVSSFTALKIYFGYFLSWAFYGFSFWLFLNSILANPHSPLAGTIGIYVFAYQIGFIAIFTPSGIGVREFALWVMLKPYIGEIAVGVAVATRLWNTVVELISAFIALAIKLPPEKKT